jgi:two-component system LytT family sensor kinase
MKKLIDIRRFKLYIWIGIAFFVLGVITNYAENQNSFLQRLLNNIWAVSYLTVLNYFFFEYTWRLLSWKGLLRSLLRIAVFIFLYSCGSYIWKYLGVNLHVYTAFKTFPSTQDAISDRMEYSMESLLFFGIIRHVYNHIKLKQASQQLRIEKQQAELNYLKSQTNPHFLFNTLNNIYSLARDKSDLAPESIMRLSKILRYMLYETSGKYIAIEQELKVINDYIALEKLRYDESLHINFNYDVEDMKQSLPPLLLIPLVENAFKHGVSETRNQPFVDIHLSVKQRRLTLIIKNSADNAIGEQNVKENIGLFNLRRQLELLYTDYSLSVEQQLSIFTATLHINLASHV